MKPRSPSSQAAKRDSAALDLPDGLRMRLEEFRRRLWYVKLLEGALAKYPDLAFMSTIQLADEFKSQASFLIETRFPNRLRTWLFRAGELTRLKKLAWVMGAGLVACSALLVALV